MNILSLFDGMSCGQIALERSGFKVNNYYASEIDKHAIKVTLDNYPNTVQLGDINHWENWGLLWGIDWASIDLVLAGSPCQGFSSAGKQLAFDDPRSVLFFTFVGILNHIKKVNPNVKFLLENVKMKKDHLDIISNYMGVEPVFINSALVSAQSRQRYYWTNFGRVEQPEDKKLSLGDVWDGGIDITDRFLAKRKGTLAYTKSRSSVRGLLNKSKCLLTSGQNIANSGATNIKIEDNYYTLKPLECERLQTVPDGYTAIESNIQRYFMLGNGWNVDTVVHILSYLK